jgi:hypothetical protein
MNVNPLYTYEIFRKLETDQKQNTRNGIKKYRIECKTHIKKRQAVILGKSREEQE